jgi:DNA polymerase III subunit delta'
MTEEGPYPEADRHGAAPHPRETLQRYGQTAAETEFLAAAASGRMHHAWLISGPTGIGKATLAWAIARFLLAGGRGDTLEADPEGAVFRQVRSLSASGLVLCRRSWDTRLKRLRREIVVEDARAIKASFQMSAPERTWRVAVIDAVDEMNKAAANALLKILEEPPERSVFLLVCHRPSRLLPTIRSRCRELRCRPLGAVDLGRALRQAGHDATETEAAALATLAGGSVGEALDLSEGGGLELYSEIVAALGTGPPLDRRRLLALSETCNGANRAERFQLLLRLLERVMARLAVSGAGQPVEAVSSAERELLARLGSNARQAGIWAENATEIRNRAETSYAVNLDPAQVILDTLLQIDAAAADAIRSAA